MSRLLRAFVAVAIVLGLALASGAVSIPALRPVVAGTWFCVGVRPLGEGICVDDPV